MLGRKKSTAPKTGIESLHVDPSTPKCRRKNHKVGKILVQRAQAVTQPGAHAWFSRSFRTRTERGLSRIVVNGIRIEGVNEAQIVGRCRKVGEQFAHPNATLALLRELEGRGSD